MKVLYDGHIYRWQSVGGVSRYFSEVISRLPEEWSPTILGTKCREDNFPHHPHLQTSNLSQIRPRSLTQPAKLELWKLRHLNRAHVFHPTFYNLTGGLSFSHCKCPVVITVFDFITANHPQLEPNAIANIESQREAILNATRIICISQSTENDLLERYPRMEGKTEVIHLGSSFPVNPMPQPKSIFEVPLFLFVGRRGTYKNFLMLLRAFAKASQSHPSIRLCLAGPPLDVEERWQIHFNRLADRIDCFVFPDEPTLQQLYASSVALLYPSRCEGFGIPPLEAMACGTVAVTSNTTSLPEVVHDAGIMLDPADEDSWTDCILQIANGKIDRDRLLMNGRERAKTLTWEKSAESHIQLYKQFA